jgi:carbonic anhydrase/acetyltransferase-like protein (isoleucine patch superfamily)
MTIDEVLNVFPGTSKEDWRQVGKGWVHATADVDANCTINGVVGANARVGEGASVGNRASVGEWASVGEGARVSQSPLYIIGTKHCVFENTDGTLSVGCQTMTPVEWLERAQEIGSSNGYTPEQIEEYAFYFELAKQLFSKRHAVVSGKSAS